MKKVSWFTMVETLVVIIVAGLLLGLTLNLGWDYLAWLKYSKDKETYMNTIQESIIRARTTNFYKGDKYTYLDVIIDTDVIQVVLGTGDTDTVTNACATWSQIIQKTYAEHSVLSGSLPLVVRLEPYQLWCEICSSGTWLFETISNIWDDKTCYFYDFRLCKISQAKCN